MARIELPSRREYEEAERRSREGILLNPKVVADLRTLAAEMGMEYDLD